MAKLITDHGLIIAEQVIDGVAVNPVDPRAERVEHIRRTDEEIALWRKRPYVVAFEDGWQVRCLDGKLSDRPSRWETATNLEEAVARDNTTLPLPWPSIAPPITVAAA